MKNQTTFILLFFWLFMPAAKAMELLEPKKPKPKGMNYFLHQVGLATSIGSMLMPPKEVVPRNYIPLNSLTRVSGEQFLEYEACVKQMYSRIAKGLHNKKRIALSEDERTELDTRLLSEFQRWPPDPNLNTIKELLDKGADANVFVRKENQDWTSLMYAVRNNSPQQVEMLLKYGADPDVRGLRMPCLMPLLHACHTATNIFSEAYLDGKKKAIKIAHLLLSAGANPNAYNVSPYKKQTALFNSAQNSDKNLEGIKNIDVMQLLLHYKANPNIPAINCEATCQNKDCESRCTWDPSRICMDSFCKNRDNLFAFPIDVVGDIDRATLLIRAGAYYRRPLRFKGSDDAKQYKIIHRAIEAIAKEKYSEYLQGLSQKVTAYFKTIPWVAALDNVVMSYIPTDETDIFKKEIIKPVDYVPASLRNSLSNQLLLHDVTEKKGY